MTDVAVADPPQLLAGGFTTVQGGQPVRQTATGPLTATCQPRRANEHRSPRSDIEAGAVGAPGRHPPDPALRPAMSPS